MSSKEKLQAQVGDEINQCLQIIVTNAGNIKDDRDGPILEQCIAIEDAVERAAKAVLKLAVLPPAALPATGPLTEEQHDVEVLAAKFHEIYQAEAKWQGDVRHKDAYADLPENIKEFDRVLARYVLELLAARQSQPAPTEKCPKCRQALFSYCANGACANFCQNVLIAQTGEAQPADKESVPAKWYRNGVLDANEIVLRFEFAYMAITGEFFLYEMFHALESE